MKRARLADDLNEKLAKRPGPLELVESGILVSSDSTLTEAIKDGKIHYPRTSALVNTKHGYHPELNEQPHQDDLFNLDDSSLNYLNFNFNNLTDNDDSNASQTSTSTTKTNNTLASISSSATSFNINSTQLVNQTLTAPPLHQQVQSNEILNFNDFQFQSSNAPSPASSTSTALIKSSPSSSPFHNYDFVNNNQTNSTVNKTKTSQNKQKSTKSFSSASSTTSSTSSTSKTIKLQRNNSNISAVSSTSSSSNTNGTSNTTKKLSQLIFHEYRGPNQKSSKTSISLKPTNIKTNNNHHNGSSNLVNNAPVNISNNNGQTSTSEIFFDDSNDSANNNLNSAMMIDNVEQSRAHDELNPHKIRMKQQKIFLKYNNTTGIKEEHWIDSNKMNSNQIEQADLSKQVTTSQSNQSIQLVPIGDIQMLFNTNNFLPIRTLSVGPFNGPNGIDSPNAQILPPPTPPNKPLNHNSSNNLYSLDTNLAPLVVATRPASTMSQSLQSINQNQYQQASPIKSLSSEILAPPTAQKTPSFKVNQKETDNKIESKLTNVDEMSLNELKEECRRRKLLVTGNKQKLIDRIKASLNGHSSNQLLLSGIKSPDSGVNMDSSPSFISSKFLNF